jgi:DNA-binding NarL/FixJ family response regulator
VAVDPYPLWLDTVVRIAESAGVKVVGETTQAHDAVAMLAERRPDLFILGLERSGSSPDLVDTLLQAGSRVDGMVTLVLSTSGEPEFVEHCLAAGAYAYAVKTIQPADLSSTIRQAVDRCVFLFDRPSAPAEPAMRADEELEQLTAREIDVLRLVAEGLSNAEVAKSLWISVPTVKYHLSSIYEKLGVPNRTGAARWAQRHGLLATDDVGP